jgi:hypothetical protein
MVLTPDNMKRFRDVVVWYNLVDVSEVLRAPNITAMINGDGKRL